MGGYHCRACGSTAVYGRYDTVSAQLHNNGRLPRNYIVGNMYHNCQLMQFLAMTILFCKLYTFINMKKLCLIFLICLSSSFISLAQQDVTQFMGIPVDGTKNQMIRKLEAKGFERLYYDSDVLTGEFNGHDVTIFIDTNNGKVSRLIVLYAKDVSERVVKTLYNNLCYQFANNNKYLGMPIEEIPDGENIAYEMSVNGKEYTGLLLQKSIGWGVGDYPENIVSIIKDKYSEEYIDNHPEEIKKEVERLYDVEMQITSNKIVWFTIIKGEYSDEYSIAIYYQNEYNIANGEDL